MFKSRILLFVVLVLLCFSQTVSEANSNGSGPPKFSSVYTDLNTQCRNAFKSVGEGQDMPLRCKGYGGYFVYIYYSAWASHIAIHTSDDDGSPALASQQLSYSDEKGRKIEWRLANGKPFAVILRISKYRESDGTDNPFDDKYKTGEALIVKGLNGQNIDFEVDVKSTPNPNEKARQLADSNYK
ncbi:MAG TPA: hypothetical protein VF528_11505 [Pyrinomonadaceae bacterium]|jgi:hypothetical protein